MAIYPKQLTFVLELSLRDQKTSATPCGAFDRFLKLGLGRLAIKKDLSRNSKNILKLGKFLISAVYLKRSGCNSRRKLESWGNTILSSQSRLNGFPMQILVNFYFGGARSKGFATLRNVSKLTFLGQDWARKVCRFSVYLEITSISSIYSLTYWRKKESRGLNQLTCVTRQIRGDSKLRD